MTAEVDGQLTAVHKKQPALQTRRWRRAVVASSALLGMLLAGAGFAPVILTQTSLRNRMLESGISQQNLKVECDEAVGGWLIPLTFRGVRISSPDGRFLCSVRELQTSKGLLSFLTDRDSSGQIRLMDPDVEVHLDDNGDWPAWETQPSNSQFDFAILNGSLRIVVPWRKVPIVELDELALSGRIAKDESGRRTLTVDPTQILDREPVSDQHASQNLALIAPVLSQSARLTGSASVWLDQIVVPLADVSGVPAADMPLSVRGRAEFHALEASLKDAWIRQLAAVAGHAVGQDLPDRVEVLKDSQVEFSITDQGITHSGMVFLLPELAKNLQVESSGTIRLDESIDLRLSMKVPELFPANNRLMSLVSQLTAAPFQLVVTGTVSEPKLQLPPGLDLLGEISQRVTPAQYQEDAPAVPTAVMELLQGLSASEAADADSDLPGNVLNLIRAIEKNAKERKASEEPRKKRRNK